MSRRGKAIDQELDLVTNTLVTLDQRDSALDDRVKAVEGKVRSNQAETIRERGLPADLVATETNVWRRLSPARNRWPEIATFDERVAELEMRQAAKADELRELRDREIAAPATDADRLATWQLNEEQGPRPEPELPAIREQIQRRQEEWEALTRATTRVLADKTAFVEKHRGRLVKEADSYADEAAPATSNWSTNWPRPAQICSGCAVPRCGRGCSPPRSLPARSLTRSLVASVVRFRRWDSTRRSPPTGYSTVCGLTPTTSTKPQRPSRSSPSRAATRAPRPTPSGTTPTRARSGSATNANGLYIGG